jgi:hypothetical protein
MVIFSEPSQEKSRFENAAPLESKDAQALSRCS